MIIELQEREVKSNLQCYQEIKESCMKYLHVNIRLCDLLKWREYEKRQFY